LSWDLWGLAPRLCQAAYGLMFYLEKSLWPSRLCALYEVPLGQSLFQPRFVAGLIFVALGGAVVLGLWRKHPALLAAAAAYTITIAPVLGFLQSGPQLVADRYAYLATIPCAILAGGLTARWAARGSTGAVLAAWSVVCMLSLTLGLLAWHQATYWRSTEQLIAHCLETGHDGSLTRINYGVQLARRGDAEGALRQFDRASELSPRHGEAWFRRGTALSALGRIADAEESYARAAGLMADSWRAHVAIGLIYMNLDRPDRAAERFRAAIANVEDPRSQSFSPSPYLMLAGALDALGDSAGERAMLLKAAQYPETRAKALDHLRDLDASADHPK
jgi:tetratricopeptide (TPR) repeat protein